MIKEKYFLVLFLSLISFCSTNSKKQKDIYKCGADFLIDYPKIEIDPKPIDYNSPLYRRRLKEVDNDGFKKFNIYMDLTNIEKEIEYYNLTKSRDIIINSINKAIDTLENILKVKSFQIDFNLEDNELLYFIGIDYWDKEKFGSAAKDKGINIFSLGIDLLIFGMFSDLGEDILAAATSLYSISKNGQPIVGIVYISNNIDFSVKNSEEYFTSIILHELTHVLGFDFTHFYYELNIVFKQNGIYYINSNKVLEVAKKYFNCSTIEGVALEDYGSYGTQASHWEAKILLGDYMNGYIYTEEQVISEFTLALLEDTGYYKVNYYTGGLMRYGKNKGCNFLNNKCVNSSHEIDPFFENEYFDSVNSDYDIDNSCSSGRQSRTYNAFWNRGNMKDNPNYFNNTYIGGWPSADFCPVPEGYSEEKHINNYIGHCSNKGSGEYGLFIKNQIDKSYKTNEEMKLITGETYSDHSFCFQSSLIHKEKNKNYDFSKNVRALCFEIFCSSKSLTVKINNDYIVCPREGGKIEVEEYDGFFLCPDYNLICSGTVICNDMFDCVNKKSEIKEDSYIYDYEIKTSQNIDRAEKEKANNETNYELSDDGICPQYCIHCGEKGECNKCKEDYYKTKKEEKIICLSKSDLKEGYYFNLNDSLYYQNIEDCKIYSNSTNCEECYFGFKNFGDKCIGPIENCKEYSDNETCKKCKTNFAFKENERKICTNISKLEEYYSKDGGISYYLCDGEGDNHIQNCKKCKYNDKLECNECKNEFYLLDEEKNICYNKKDINDKNNLYFYSNSTHAKTCSKTINNCKECSDEYNCIKCEDNYYLLNDITNKCYNIKEIIPIEQYYLNGNKSTYYSCKNIKYNSFANCMKCSGNNTCSYCTYDYTFVNGNKTECINNNSLEYGKYYLDPDDDSNYNSCSFIDKNCLYCISWKYCLFCSEIYGLLDSDKRCTLLSDFYNNSKIYRVFLLEAEFFVERFFTLYILTDFQIPNDFYMEIPIIVTKKDSDGNNIQIESKKVDFYITYSNEEDNLYILEPMDYLPLNISDIKQVKIDPNNFTDNKNNNIKYIINDDFIEYNFFTQSVLGKINNSKIYKVKDISSIKEENSFNLILNEAIELDKKINIQFVEKEDKSNIIIAECILSYNNNNIPCTLNTSIYKNYLMKDYIYKNKTEGVLIGIIIENKDEDLILTNEPSTFLLKKESKKSSTKIIIIIVVSSCVFIAIIVGIIIFISKKKVIKNDIHAISNVSSSLEKMP